MEFNTYKNEEFGFQISYPLEWEIAEDFMGSVVMFLSPQETSEDTFRENLNIMVQDLTAQPMTLEQYTEISMGQFRQIVTDFKILSPLAQSSLLNYPGHELHFTGKQGQHKLTWYSTWSLIDHNAYILTCTGEKKRFKRFWPTFREMVSAFRLE